MNRTPEQEWEHLKKKLFTKEVPEEIEKIVQKGFSESQSDSEKWMILNITLNSIRNKVYNPIK